MNKIFEYRKDIRKILDHDNDNYMTRMGKNGWELVTVLLMGDSMYFFWKFEIP